MSLCNLALAPHWLRGTLSAVALVAGCFLGTSAKAELLTYTLSGSSISGTLGSTGFTGASWSMTMTADPATVISGTYSVGPGFPYNYVAGSPHVTINTGSSTLTATLVPATVGNTVGLISYGVSTNLTDIFNQFQEISPAAVSPPNLSLGVKSASLNSLDAIGSFGVNQYQNATASFNTDQGTLSLGPSFSNITGSFTIASAPDPSAVPEIDPNSLGSVLALVLGSLGLLERRRLKAA
jgi:hypothetical protein